MPACAGLKKDACIAAGDCFWLTGKGCRKTASKILENAKVEAAATRSEARAASAAKKARKARLTASAKAAKAAARAEAKAAKAEAEEKARKARARAKVTAQVKKAREAIQEKARKQKAREEATKMKEAEKAEKAAKAPAAKKAKVAAVAAGGQRLAGVFAVFTGFRDAALMAAMAAEGAAVQGSITRSTNLVLYREGGKPGTKLDVARARGIRVLEVRAFAAAHGLPMAAPAAKKA